MAAVFSPPDDLPEPLLRAALASGWALEAVDLTYCPVGFGSHHWELVDRRRERWFVTVDDLRTRRRRTGEPLADCHVRLQAALATACALQESGCDFVVAPRASRAGDPVLSLADSFAVAVYPFIDGERFGWGSYTPAHRRAVLELIAAVHAAPPEVCRRALVDDYAIPSRDAVESAVGGAGGVEGGPYARRSIDLLASRASAVRRGLERYDALVHEVRSRPPAMVLTHGEPHAGNTMRSRDGWLLIDWDTALLAPPERDLWDLDEGDGRLHTAYTALTGTPLRPDLLRLYRLRWDLSDLAAAVARFGGPHGSTADDEETWTILEDIVGGLGRDDVSGG